MALTCIRSSIQQKFHCVLGFPCFPPFIKRAHSWQSHKRPPPTPSAPAGLLSQGLAGQFLLYVLLQTLLDGTPLSQWLNVKHGCSAHFHLASSIPSMSCQICWSPRPHQPHKTGQRWALWSSVPDYSLFLFWFSLGIELCGGGENEGDRRELEVSAHKNEQRNCNLGLLSTGSLSESQCKTIHHLPGTSTSGLAHPRETCPGSHLSDQS